MIKRIKRKKKRKKKINKIRKEVLLLKIKLVLISLIILSFAGCFKKINHVIDIKNKDLYITCTINRIEEKNVNVESKRLKKYYIYSNLKVVNTGMNSTSYSIDEYYLKYNSYLSSKTYIDSIASHIIKQKEIKPGEEHIFNVYWVFDKAIEVGQLQSIELIQISKK